MFGKKSKKQKQEEVFGGSATINPTPAAVDTAAASAVNTGGAIDIDEALTQTTPAPSAAQPAAPTTPAKEKGQTKQLTISLMTIIFFILFVAATAAAVYFYIQNNKNKANYDDISAKYESLKSTNDNSATSSTKSKTQYDALQTKIKDLTKDNKELTKTVNDNKKTINDLNTKNATLTKQAADANKKLTADKTVSDQMEQLVTTMCTSKEFSKSSACVNSSSSSNSDRFIEFHIDHFFKTYCCYKRKLRVKLENIDEMPETVPFHFKLLVGRIGLIIKYSENCIWGASIRLCL